MTKQDVSNQTKIEIEVLENFEQIDTYQLQLICNYFYVKPLYFLLHKYVKNENSNNN